MKTERLEELRERIYEQYMKRTPRSRQLYDRACKSLVAGVAASSRFYEPYPLYMSHGEGSRIFDVDENEYIDCHLNYGPLLLGHCHPQVIEAMRKELDKGLLMANPEITVEYAELLKGILPWADMVSFANTGVEVIMLAVRVARAFTGKNKIIKFYGHFHGQYDQLLVAIYNTSDKPNSAGITSESLSNTILAKYMDIDIVKDILAKDNDIAAIILDPLMSMGGLWPPSHEYLKELRQVTESHGALLIFDEIISGFRLAPGGASEFYGVAPDLAVYAKGMAAGGKLAALVGKKNIMSPLVPAEITTQKEITITHGATFVDGTAAFAAAIASLKAYKEMKKSGGYKRLFQMSEELKMGIELALQKCGVPCHINALGGCLKVYLTNLAPSFEVYSNLDTTVRDLFALSLIPEGVKVMPKGGRVYLSFAHTTEDIQAIIDSAKKSAERYRFHEFFD